MESPYKDSWPDVCVCVCIYLYIYIYIYYINPYTLKNSAIKKKYNN